MDRAKVFWTQSHNSLLGNLGCVCSEPGRYRWRFAGYQLVWNECWNRYLRLLHCDNLMQYRVCESRLDRK